MTLFRIHLTTILIFLLTAQGFSQVQVKKVMLKKIEFSSATRGYQETIAIDKNSLDIVQTGVAPKEEHSKITKKDWQIFRNIVQQIDLKKINKLAAPSHKSHTDAAKASHFIITTSKGKYESVTFDNYDAPKELIPLVKKMMACAKLQK